MELTVFFHEQEWNATQVQELREKVAEELIIQEGKAWVKRMKHFLKGCVK